MARRVDVAQVYYAISRQTPAWEKTYSYGTNASVSSFHASRVNPLDSSRMQIVIAPNVHDPVQCFDVSVDECGYLCGKDTAPDIRKIDPENPVWSETIAAIDKYTSIISDNKIRVTHTIVFEVQEEYAQVTSAAIIAAADNFTRSARGVIVSSEVEGLPEQITPAT